MQVRVGPVAIGGGAPLVVLAGPCVVESRDSALRHAEALAGLARDRGLASLQHCVLVAHDAWQVDHFRRLPDGSWRMKRHGPGERLDLDALGVTLAVDDLYDKVEAFGGPARTARPDRRPSGRVVVGA